MVIRRRTRHHAPPGFLASPSRAGGLSTHLPLAETLLTWLADMFDDVSRADVALADVDVLAWLLTWMLGLVPLNPIV